ncbi:MAG: hypothetical protein LIO96_11765 [Lachnospiraceae bacterium]|nr:hypothetical protein [Lachnospiraceae bacterium]
MRELKIELPNYEGRETDVNTIVMIAERFGLEYDAMKNPKLTVTDVETDEVLLKSEGLMRCYISGEESAIDEFLRELMNWFTKF